MRLVAKINEIGLLVDFYPVDWFIVFPIAGENLYFLTLGGDHGVTAHALLDRGKTCHWGSHGTGMAIEALNTGFSMSLMAKINWLGRCGLFPHPGQKNAAWCADDNEQYDDKEPTR
jgi:hypothetical protein